MTTYVLVGGKLILSPEGAEILMKEIQNNLIIITILHNL